MVRLLAIALLALAGCGGGDRATVDRAPGELFAEPPYMGVSCPEPNSIACDRVGLAIWLREPAEAVTAEIEGRPLSLAEAGAGGPTHFQGFLQPAGLRDGPLRVRTEGGARYTGRTPVEARVRVRVQRADRTESTELKVRLSAGWG